MRELDLLLAERRRRTERTRLFRYQPYKKQKQFHALGADHSERLLMAANKVGKTYCGAAEMSIHLTGRYPDWWEGRRWSRPIRAWCGSDTYDNTRNGTQRLLVGEPEDEQAWGTGLIPGDDLLDWSRHQGSSTHLDGLLVRHVTGGCSMLAFKSYDQGRRRWQVEDLDAVWFDEEPEEDIYTEGKTRVNARNGMIYMTFTPLMGESTVVHEFIEECGLD